MVTDTTAIMIAVFAPVISAVLMMAVRSTGLASGRIVTLGCGIGAVAAWAVVAISGINDDAMAGAASQWGLHADRASAVLLAAVATTGLVVASFARRNLDMDPRAPRFFLWLATLVTCSGLVVTQGSGIFLVIGWIGSTWGLVALVGHRREVAETRGAQRRTVRSLIVGDVAVVFAVALMAMATPGSLSTEMATIAGGLSNSTVWGVATADVVAVLLVLAGASRSALFPWHRWLVATLAAPTPVSALVHAGFVSGAGILIIRFHELILNSAVAVHLAFFLAITTIILALGAGEARVDVKGKLAWSTASQMGFMVMQATVGALSSAVLHIVGHGMYKASMFLGAGDAITAGLRSTRRAAPLPVMPVAPRRAWSGAIATVATGLGMWILPPQVSDGGVILVAVFAWTTTVYAVWAWLSRGAMARAGALLTGAAGAGAAAFLYLGGLRVTEHFLEPAVSAMPSGPGVSVTTLLITLGAAAVAVAVVRVDAGSATHHADSFWRQSIRASLARTAHPALSTLRLRRAARRSRRLSTTTAPSTIDSPDLAGLNVSRSQIRADIARASSIVAPMWPLTSFVPVNPLGGMEQLGFDSATQSAREYLGARTHLTLNEYRADHHRGITTADDLAWAVESSFVEVCVSPGVSIGGTRVSAAQVIQLDLLHGPEAHAPREPVTALERDEGAGGALGALIDATLCHSAAQWAAQVPSRRSRVMSFRSQWLRDALSVADLRHHLGHEAQQWLSDLDGEPTETIIAAFALSGIDQPHRVAEMRGHLARIKGWAGYAKWRTDWAHADERRAALAPIDLVAARCALEAACLLTDGRGGATPSHGSHENLDHHRRVDAILVALDASDSDTDREDIAAIVRRVEPEARHTCWLRAQERAIERQLLSRLNHDHPRATPVKPRAQLVFCIDVRSEGLRRHLEATGDYETMGFAGFFGVALSVRRLPWEHPEARCPVLVAPSVRAVERPFDDPAMLADCERMVARDRAAAGASQIHSLTKSAAGASFAMAEAAGWFVGPVAAVRTLAPRRVKGGSRSATTMAIEAAQDGGLDHEQRLFTAETVLRTMGLTEGFAPVVVLCGHASTTVNNPHATALDCGACAGASGQDNARAVAGLLNDPEIRVGLRARGINIPAGTHVVAAVHDTVTDHVEVLDRHLIPAAHERAIRALESDLRHAGRLQSADRAAALPGRPASVTHRGGDWAQVRPEWGLARNSSFIIGPRSLSAGVNLEGRSFLHHYDAALDDGGKVLETIMTAPLVVAHWISAQYYFSTVDPDVFGAGDKVLHNIIGDTGVIQGEQGDLRVGLPWQSTHVGGQRHHQPVRLLAVIEAPLERIERIIQENPILTTLVEGEWIRIAGRSRPHEPWSTRTPGGTWSTEPHSHNTTHAWETS